MKNVMAYKSVVTKSHTRLETKSLEPVCVKSCPVLTNDSLFGEDSVKQSPQRRLSPRFAIQQTKAESASRIIAESNTYRDTTSKEFNVGCHRSVCCNKLIEKLPRYFVRWFDNQLPLRERLMLRIGSPILELFSQSSEDKDCNIPIRPLPKNVCRMKVREHVVRPSEIVTRKQ